jgi:hypothetical protein
MTGIDGFLKDAAIEVQPGELAVDEALRSGGDHVSGLRFTLFLFNNNLFRGVHEIVIHPVQAALQCRQFTADIVPVA